MSDVAFPFTSVLALCALAWAWCVSLAMPLYMGFAHPPRVLTEDEMNSLPDLLRTPIGHECFKQFLKLEFSLENLFFWTSVNDYRAHAESVLASSSAARAADDIRSLLQEAMTIYATFIDSATAVHEINLSAAQLRRVQTSLDYYNATYASGTAQAVAAATHDSVPLAASIDNSSTHVVESESESDEQRTKSQRSLSSHVTDEQRTSFMHHLHNDFFASLSRRTHSAVDSAAAAANELMMLCTVFDDAQRCAELLTLLLCLLLCLVFDVRSLAPFYSYCTRCILAADIIFHCIFLHMPAHPKSSSVPS